MQHRRGGASDLVPACAALFKVMATLLTSAFPGYAPPDGVAIGPQGKERTVFRTGRSTREVARMAPSAQTAFDAVAIEGGLPVIIDAG